MKKVILLIPFILLIFSCSNNDKVVASLVKDKVETMSGHEVIRDLLIENDGDVEQLARIFKCSVPTINRVLGKETYLTDSALSEFRNLLVGVKVSGNDTFKENDPYYDSWIRSFRYWLNEYVYWGSGLIILLIIIGLSTGDSLYDGDLGFGVYIFYFLISVFVGGYLKTWILNMIWPYEVPSNLYHEKINPIIETLL